MITEEELYEVSAALRVFDAYCNRLRASSHHNYKPAIDIASPNSFVQALTDSCDRERTNLIQDLRKANDYLSILISRLELIQSSSEKRNG